ncbi:hypothetical protein H4582DRAFT_1917283 [Lactarius indigo]|nr:hypothetical protein H4582DRAFT_1917283 [Lactarius indigo]
MERRNLEARASSVRVITMPKLHTLAFSRSLTSYLDKVLGGRRVSLRPLEVPRVCQPLRDVSTLQLLTSYVAEARLHLVRLRPSLAAPTLTIRSYGLSQTIVPEHEACYVPLVPSEHHPVLLHLVRLTLSRGLSPQLFYPSQIVSPCHASTPEPHARDARLIFRLVCSPAQCVCFPHL